jgi:hypothetical protein
MWQVIEPIFRQFETWRYRRNVRRALALHSRGEVRPDGLVPVKIRNRLEIRWRARDIHPWDAGVPEEQRAELLHEQLVSDTEAAIVRLFEALPQIDRIDLQVLAPEGDTVLLAGAVHRSALETVRSLRSVRMRLRQLGVDFCQRTT